MFCWSFIHSIGISAPFKAVRFSLSIFFFFFGLQFNQYLLSHRQIVTNLSCNWVCFPFFVLFCFFLAVVSSSWRVHIEFSWVFKVSIARVISFDANAMWIDSICFDSIAIGASTALIKMISSIFCCCCYSFHLSPCSKFSSLARYPFLYSVREKARHHSALQCTDMHFWAIFTAFL